MAALPTRPAGLAASPAAGLVALAFVGIFVVLALAHPRPVQRISDAAAVAVALRDPTVKDRLRDGYDRVRTTPLDDRMLRVSFFEGRRIALEAAVAPDGKVASTAAYKPGQARTGGEVVQHPLVLALLVAVFALASAGAPLRSLRNLDVLALASFVVPVLLLNERLLEASVYAGVVPLGYLCIRCALVAFRPRRDAHAFAPLVALPRRMLRLAVAAAVGGLVLLSIPGGLVGDVAFASMAGATKLAHGGLPYGQLVQTELVHGDTYPLLAYAAYLPAALVTPVRSGFDQLDGALWTAVGFALAAAIAMYRAGGLRLALAWLCFPPVAIAASAGANDVAAAACVAWAAALFSKPGRSAAMLAVAGLVKLAPLAVLPIWLARGPRRAALPAVAVIAGTAAWIVILGGPRGLADMVEAVSFQAERGSLLSLWTLSGATTAQLVVQAAVATMALAGMFKVARDPGRIAALGAAILLGAQLGASYWTATYLVWAFPLVAVALLAPDVRRVPAPAPRRAAHP